MGEIIYALLRLWCGKAKNYELSSIISELISEIMCFVTELKIND